jgi:hypothetical protein
MKLINANCISEARPEDLVPVAIKGVLALLAPLLQYMKKTRVILYKKMRNKIEGIYKWAQSFALRPKTILN